MGHSGGTSINDYYIVALDEDLGYSGGSMNVYNGSGAIPGSWVTRSPDAEMPFRIIGERDTIAQLKEAIEVSPEFLSVLPSPASSGVLTRQYREDDRNAADEVAEMLELGTSDGKRLTARVDFGRNVIIEIVPESADTNPMLGADGQLLRCLF